MAGWLLTSVAAGHDACTALHRNEKVVLWQALVAAQHRAVVESAGAFPDSPERRRAYREALEAQYFEQAAGGYGISREQQYGLLLEGYLRAWPLPGEHYH